MIYNFLLVGALIITLAITLTRYRRGFRERPSYARRNNRRRSVQRNPDRKQTERSPDEERAYMYGLLAQPTDTLLNMEPELMEEFLQWLRQSKLSGSQEMYQAILERQQLWLERKRIEEEIRGVRQARAEQFGPIGRLLYALTLQD